MKPLFALLTLTTIAGAAPLQRVAYDDAGQTGKEPHLLDGESWAFRNPGDADDAARTCVFGDAVSFGYTGLKQESPYRIRLTLFADEARVMRLKAGNADLGEVRVEKGKVATPEFAIPPSAIAGENLTITLERLSGPNAVVSAVEILSENPAPLPPLPAGLRGDAFTMDMLPVLHPLPQAVEGVSSPALDLGGTWKFKPDPAPGSALRDMDTAAWPDIKVPGEWAMQGFEVKPGTAAVYARDFTVPADWNGKRVILRCDAVYSDSAVHLNGREITRHSGGFTPFEADLTKHLKPGANRLAFTALNDTVADQLASGSKYACHPLGGINRGIRLVALPQTRLTSLRVITRFDSAWRDAVLQLDTAVAGEGAGLLATLTPAAGGTPVFTDRPLAPGLAEIPVAAPAKWDPEHPNLYQLTLKITSAGKTVETVTRRIGFRQVEVRGNELYVNNRPVKLRGSNHHEVYPLTGRSLPPGIHRRDIELFREGNVNLLRTCHYPPDEALMEAADELGMFIECEAPFCWAPGKGHEKLVCLQTAEMALTFRNHPSVLFWSIANESQWGSHFVASSKLLRELDPSRPQVFNDNGSKSDPAVTDFMNGHYPGHGGPDAVRKGRHSQPLYLGEDSHLNAYNRLELATDPALRDLWGRYLRELWDDIYQTKGCLGQSIWSGVDDTFYMSGDRTVGYGTWGPIDGWRRKKPEWWNMKKAYSPVRLGEPEFTGGGIRLTVENRSNFTNLGEMSIRWQQGAKSGEVTAAAEPGSKAALSIPAKPGEPVRLTFGDPRGFIADDFLLDKPAPPALPAGPAPQWRVDEKTGLFATLGGIKLDGPRLMLLPLNSAGETQMTGKTKVWTPFTEPCAGWTCESVKREGSATIVRGGYDGAKGEFRYAPRGGGLEIGYQFEITKAVNPRQTGLVFTLPVEYETLAWKRTGYWSAYPDDHIARLSGSVKAGEGFPATSVGPREKPEHPWRLDNLPCGNNDFCSTKHNILTAALTAPGGRGLLVHGGGLQHIRCWKTDTGVHFLVADYSNGGSERFLRGLASKDDRPLKPGDKVSGKILLSITGASR